MPELVYRNIFTHPDVLNVIHTLYMINLMGPGFIFYYWWYIKMSNSYIPACYDRLVYCVFCFNFVGFAGQMTGATTASPGIFPNIFPSTPGQVYSFF